MYPNFNDNIQNGPTTKFVSVGPYQEGNIAASSIQTALLSQTQTTFEAIPNKPMIMKDNKIMLASPLPAQSPDLSRNATPSNEKRARKPITIPQPQEKQSQKSSMKNLNES